MIEKERVSATFSNNLRNLITAKGCSQNEVAELVGTSQTNISQWSNGKIPPLHMAMALADLFNTTVSEMVGEVPAYHYENSRYEFRDDTFCHARPVIELDEKELESMEYLHDKGIVKDDEYMAYTTKKLKEIAKEITHE